MFPLELGRDDSSTNDGKCKVIWGAAAASDGGGDERMRILKFIKRNITVLDNMSKKKFSHCKRKY